MAFQAIPPQAIAHLPAGEEGNASQAIAHLPPGEDSNHSPADTHLPVGEGGGLVASQAGTHLPIEEGSNLATPQAIAHLPPGEEGNTSQSIAHLPPGEDSNSTLVAGNHSQISNNSPSGQAVRQARSARHRALQASRENNTASQADSANSWEGNPTPQ